MIAPPKRYRFFCGIDAHKRTHVACVLDPDAQVRVRPCAFPNDAEGFQRLEQRLRQLGPAAGVLTGMEATGHYWHCLHDFLRRGGYHVALLNPIQTAQQAKKGIRKTTTDKISARHIAMLLRSGEYRPAQVPGDLATTCRFVTRLRYALLGHQKRAKQLLRSRLHPAWPEYETYFADPFCATSRALLAAAPTPEDLLALPLEQVAGLLRSVSRGKVGGALAERIYASAAQSVGIRRGLEGIRICLHTLLAELEALATIRKQLQRQIEQLADRLPPYLLTLPAATALHAASLYGEIDPVQTFVTPRKLVAFAGLDPAVHQSGQSGSLRRRISKRGSPFLRQTLWLMAHRAVYLEGDLRDYFLRKRAAGLHYLAAVTAAAVKLTHVVWRIMTDARDYLPAAPSRRS
jgi:transposase